MPLLSLCIQDAVQKEESRDYIRLKKKMAVRYLDQKLREKHVSSEKQLEKPVSGAAAAKGKSKR